MSFRVFVVFSIVRNIIGVRIYIERLYYAVLLEYC